ncbi:MAG TPA: ATP-binding cassette domain-containing protein [Gemmatimonadales bacterium]|nr:ATP-binding cassette domain-containing protein [Gemmatimonadales bacterium]
MTASRVSIVLGPGVAAVEGAPPLAYREVDLLDRPDRADRRFSLTVAPGEVVAAIGDEGSGIERLGRLALGLEAPAAGAVEVFGVPIALLPYYDLLAFRRRLGYLPDGDGLLQNLTLKDNVALPVRFATDHRLREVEARVAQLVEDFRLRSIQALRPAQANEEDRRRAAMARAVALNPRLVVLELPFVGLTSRAATDLLDKVSRGDDGSRRAVLLTSRDLTPSVRGLVSRIVRVTDGVGAEDSKRESAWR